MKKDLSLFPFFAMMLLRRGVHGHCWCRAQSARAATSSATASRKTTQLQRPIKPCRIWQPETYKSRVLELFDQWAGDYHEGDFMHGPRATRLVGLAELKAGDIVLDIATGTGLVANRACRAVGPTGEVHGLDFSEGMLQELQSRLRLGPNDGKLFLDVGDVEEIECDDATYDAILCSASMSYLLDPVQAVRQWRWWLKPGGRLCFNIDAAPYTKMTHVVFQLCEQYGLHLQEASAPLGTAKAIRKVLADAGYQDVKVTATAANSRQAAGRSPEEYIQALWEMHLTDLMLPLQDMLTEKQLESLADQFRVAIEPLVHALPRDKDGGVVDETRKLWARAVA